MTTYLVSECCETWVVVPVEVTAHLLVRGDGSLSQSITDRASTIRQQALANEADLNEAYCSNCGRVVAVTS